MCYTQLSSLSSCTRMYNCLTGCSTSQAKCVNIRNRHGWRWFHAEARFALIANLVVRTPTDGRGAKQQQVLNNRSKLVLYRCTRMYIGRETRLSVGFSNRKSQNIPSAVFQQHGLQRILISSFPSVPFSIGINVSRFFLRLTPSPTAA